MSMPIKSALSGALLGAVLAAALGSAVAAPPPEHPSVKRPVSVAPSMELSYRIDARQRGFGLSGDAVVSWRVTGERYVLTESTRATLLGKILEHRSEGSIDSFGIAPHIFYEKRFRKEPATTTFNRAAKTITFTEGDERYPIKGGEQDRSTATWQLLSIARAAPDKFTPGSEWTFFVAGRHDAEAWTFKVVGEERIATGSGEVAAVHLSKAPPADSKDQTVDLWLAPSLDWAPVRLRFTDDNGDFVDQTLTKLTRK
jgi:hypothetical protein